MSTIARGTKASAGGGTSFVANTDALAAEVEYDFATLYSDYNGNISDANVASGAAIEETKIDGQSDSAAERRTETSPGDTASPSDATTLAGEIARLRFKIKELGLGTATARQTTAAADDVYWIDTPQMGPNLIRNGNFAVKTTAAGSAPDGWALVGTPATCTTTTAGVTEGHLTMRAIQLAAGAGDTNEGIQQTLAGLKASTKYVVGCRAKVSGAGGEIFSLTTTGADGATFNDLNLTTSSATYVTLAGQIITDATPTDIVVQLLAVGNSDIVEVTHCWVRECATDRLPMSNTAWAYDEVTTITGNHYALGAFTNSDAGLSVNVVTPGPGYVIEVEAFFDVSDTTATGFVGQLRENGTGVAIATCGINGGLGGAAIRHVNLSPTPGTTYSYTLFGAGEGSTVGLNHTAVAGETPKTWIRCRAVLESGGH